MKFHHLPLALYFLISFFTQVLVVGVEVVISTDLCSGCGILSFSTVDVGIKIYLKADNTCLHIGEVSRPAFGICPFTLENIDILYSI